MLTDNTTEVHIETVDPIVIQPKGASFKPIIGGLYKIDGLRVSNLEFAKRYDFTLTTTSKEILAFAKLSQTS